jgi:hypothetical protein
MHTPEALPAPRLVIVIPVAVDASVALTSLQASRVPVIRGALLALGLELGLVDPVDDEFEAPHEPHDASDIVATINRP